MSSSLPVTILRRLSGISRSMLLVWISGTREVDMAGVRKKPPHFDEDDEEQDHPGDPDNEAPETPTDEPAPVPIRDPPSHDVPKPPLTVRLPDVRSV
jgi:hypothetical protein